MVTEAAPAVEVQTPLITPETEADSSVVIPSISDGGDEQAVTQTGDETSAASEESSETTQDQDAEPVPPAQRLAELQGRHDAAQRGDAGAEPLTSAEKTDLSRLQQSQADSARAEAKRRSDAKQRTANLLSLKSQVAPALVRAWELEQETAEAEGRPIHRSFVEANAEKVATALFNEVEPLVLAQHEETIRTNLVAANPAMADYVVDKNLPELVSIMAGYNYELGKLQAPSAKENATLKEKVTKLEAEISKLTGGRGKGASPVMNGNSIPTTSVTYAQLTKMSQKELDALPEGVFESVMAPKGK